jgi:multimeric flavodoxin WrbA
MIRILGISGSPVKKGNVETFLEKICKSAAAEDIQYETVSL